MRWIAAAVAICAALAAAIYLHVRHAGHGKRLVYRATMPEPALRIVRERLDRAGVAARVTLDGDKLVVDVPGEVPPELESLIGRLGQLVIMIVDDCGVASPRGCMAGGDHTGAPFVKRIAQALREHPRPGIAVQLERGAPYLEASDRAVLASYLQELAAADPAFAPPIEHALGLAHTAGGWRTYYLEQAVRLDYVEITSAKATGRTVTIELATAASVALEQTTRDRIGMQLALIVDGAIASTLVITAPMTRLAVTVRDPHDAAELAIALETGTFPAPLELVSTTSY